MTSEPALPASYSTKRFRAYQTAAYFWIGLAGAVLMIDPTRSIQNQEILIRVILAGFLVVGCILTVFGAAHDVWIPEFIGLPFLGGAVGAIVAILVDAGSTGALAVACFLCAIVVLLTRRFHDLWRLSAAMKSARREQT